MSSTPGVIKANRRPSKWPISNRGRFIRIRKFVIYQNKESKNTLFWLSFFQWTFLMKTWLSGYVCQNAFRCYPSTNRQMPWCKNIQDNNPAWNFTPNWKFFFTNFISNANVEYNLNPVAEGSQLQFTPSEDRTTTKNTKPHLFFWHQNTLGRNGVKVTLTQHIYLLAKCSIRR